MSTEQEISAEDLAEEFHKGWDAAMADRRAFAEGQKMEWEAMRQRGDMAEERERKLREALDAGDYYISRLQRMVDGLPVRDLPESEGAYHRIKLEAYNVS